MRFKRLVWVRLIGGVSIIGCIVMTAGCGGGGGGAPIPHSITVSPNPTTVVAGQTTTLTITATDSNGNQLTLPPDSITWSLSNTAVATVDTNGTVSGKALGSVTITASDSQAHLQSSATVTIIPATITVSPNPATVIASQTVTLTVAATDSNGNQLTLPPDSITWSSSNTAVATVDTNGKVTGVAAGTVTITATYAPGNIQGVTIVNVLPDTGNVGGTIN